VNRSELNWLLQTIKSAEMADRFLLAQYERGRISLEVMADVARETGMDQPHLESILMNTGTRHLNEYATTELPVVIA